jgi:lipopolysaccharide/colanic/teichoic acid biosynthesis glycosyltransferase
MASKYASYKRGFDLITAAILLLLLLPVFVLLIVFTYLDQKRVFFRQVRIGKNNKPFYILKFNTIIHNNGQQTITPYADFIRSHALDEFPQLINVLKGEMSIVGPRPLYPEYLPFYTREEEERHTVRPGITGLAQVSGGNNVSWNEKLQLDLKYIQHLSFKQDVNILMKTFLHIFKKSKHWDVLPLNVEREPLKKQTVG